ncbi:hypothetical protein OHV05_04365 [Kitasatospora sp. NBC_00070]|uniref:hypothetical protein n=1 Tax=Kitasatospora sp. NBC_00070 TaxID=2975962 RepID=UPI003243C1DF
MTMWIGRPGALREITDGAEQFDRSPDLGATEFRALSGAVTTWSPPVQPARWSLSWSRMQRPEWSALDRLARRLDSPGPLALIDPLSANWLTSTQAAGRGSAGQWIIDPGMSLVGGADAYSPASVTVWGDLTTGLDLFWTHPAWNGYPVAPGQTIAFHAPSLATVAGQFRFNWLKADGTYLSTTVENRTTMPIVRTAPAGAAMVQPGIRFSVTGTWPVGTAYLREATAADTLPETPVTEQLTGTQAAGLAPASQWQVSPELTIAVSGQDVQVSQANGPGGILRWLHPGGKPGWPVQPGEYVLFGRSPTLLAVGGTSRTLFEFLTTDGQLIPYQSEGGAAVVPSGAAYVRPTVTWGIELAKNVKIGACSLRIYARHPAGPVPGDGEGIAKASITEYSITAVPGFPDERNVSIGLVEVI